ncbi:hypothetical protein V6N11_065922 [Hibiscus sabdariffa]|uniref:TOD1/MUCI70 glycosyltransferase-like domain-containing protein n=1 Tax=Hibiscus sabdariffa TaxID=183260 RepID=A0ABR2PIV3_9ROSI
MKHVLKLLSLLVVISALWIGLLQASIIPQSHTWYSIWLDSKLRLQRDPLQLLDYFLWRKGHMYAISDHYDRHCVVAHKGSNKLQQCWLLSRRDEGFRGNGSGYEVCRARYVEHGAIMVGGVDLAFIC